MMVHEFEKWIRTPGAPKQALDAQHNFDRDRHQARYIRQVRHFLNQRDGNSNNNKQASSSPRPSWLASGEVDPAALSGGGSGSGGGGGGGFTAVGHTGNQPGDGAPCVFGDNPPPHGHVMMGGGPDDRVVGHMFEDHGIGERQGANDSTGCGRGDRGGRREGDAGGGGDGGAGGESGSSHDQVCLRVYVCVCVCASLCVCICIVLVEYCGDMGIMCLSSIVGTYRR